MTADRREENGLDRRRAEELSVLATTRALDQLTAEEEASLAAGMNRLSREELLITAEQARRLAPAVRESLAASELPPPSKKLLAAVEAELDAALVSPVTTSPLSRNRRWRWLEAVAVVVLLIGVAVGLLQPAVQSRRAAARHLVLLTDSSESAFHPADEASYGTNPSSSAPEKQDPTQPTLDWSSRSRVPTDSAPRSAAALFEHSAAELHNRMGDRTVNAGDSLQTLPSPYHLSDDVQYFQPAKGWRANESAKAAGGEVILGHSWAYRNESLTEGESARTKYYSVDRSENEKRSRDGAAATGEAYAAIRENRLRLVRDEPLSTFSIDVDTASYANVRRFLTDGRLPPADAVRIEELLNYFSYDYPQPQSDDPFSVNMEVAECPWRPENWLLRVGLKGREVARQQRAPSNLVFLIDVSGSMQPDNKLPLIKTALKMLVRELTESDSVSIVTYAGDAGLKLPPTNGADHNRIVNSIESLSAGGSTHGSAGIELAYEQATGYFLDGGTNRVILLTDGDLNVGITDDDSLVQLIQRKAKTGVFLTVLGVGEGNLKDSKMEKLADHGNGVYAYLDSVREARKVFVEQLSGSLETIAKDVKLQIEFNPAHVEAYRLVGYENRVLANRDFHDDSKDAGEIGAGHSVTAMYELVPSHAAPRERREPLKYQPQRSQESPGASDDVSSLELLTLKLRFKRPQADRSELRDFAVTTRGGRFGRASADFRFAASVAMFGMVLRDSPHRGNSSLAAVEEIASSSLGADRGGYRAEFVDLVRKAETLK